MKKHRIVEYSSQEFVLQERELFIWYNMHKYYGGIYTFYKSLKDAEEALKEILSYRADILKKKEDEKLKLKNAKYYYVEDKNGN